MGPVYELLGLTVGCVQEGWARRSAGAAYARRRHLPHREGGRLRPPARRARARRRRSVVQRPFHFALVDEADSILIDEARIPLVIAGETREAGRPATRLAALVRGARARASTSSTDEHAPQRRPHRGGHRRSSRRALGVRRACTTPRTSRSYAPLRQRALHAGHLLRARRRLHRARTGGRARGRVRPAGWPTDGTGPTASTPRSRRRRACADAPRAGSWVHHAPALPAALPAALAGMTGTAQTRGRGARGVLRPRGGRRSPPTGRWSALDRPDVVFTHRGGEGARRSSAEIARASTPRGGRCSSGTASVEESERPRAALVAARASRAEVLNAKNDERGGRRSSPAAGALGAVTISTNMAGRGTDIRLGGERDEDARPRSRPLGGLYVIGTNRHESRRIDQQLRGRAGRQGDPGESRFFVSLEDAARPPLRRRAARVRPAPAAPGRTRRSRARLLRAEIAQPAVVEDEGFRLRRRSSATPTSSRSSGEPSSAGARRCSSGRRAAPARRARRPSAYARPTPARRARAVLDEVERRLLLLAIDRCWSDHLAELREMREDSVLLAFAGRFPLAEFHRQAGRASRRSRTG